MDKSGIDAGLHSGIRDENSILAAFISELPEGILVCDAEGRISLFNRRAAEFLTGQEGESDVAGRAIGLGRSVFEAMDRHAVEHALDEIGDKLRRSALNAVAWFTVQGHGGRTLQARALPILERPDRFAGFILILHDITDQLEIDRRVETLFRSLTRSSKSPLASIRSAAEILLEHSDMASEKRRPFQEIIHKEALALDAILDRVADEYAAVVRAQRPLTPVGMDELTGLIRRRANEKLGIHIQPDGADAARRVKADTFAMVTAALFLLDRLREKTGARAFALSVETSRRSVFLDLLWPGRPVDGESLKNWGNRFLIVGKAESRWTLNEVFGRHGAEMWSAARPDGDGRAYLRIALPADETPAVESARPVVVVPEVRSMFCEFDPLAGDGEEGDPDDRMMIELSYAALIREILGAPGVGEIAEKRRRLPGLIRRMLAGGTNVRNITRLITRFSDAALHRLMELALADLGPPPVPFAFITLGSEGRKEQTLKTDQDNALIFQDAADGRGSEAEDYFLQLGKTVCAWLDAAGYDFCQGGVMAQNPRWRQPLSAWERYFSDWIYKASPEDLLHAAIFFDFRFAYGDRSLAARLQERLFGFLNGWGGFFRNMTENAVRFKPPSGVFRRFSLPMGRRRNRTLDLKGAATPLVDIVRIYALRHGVRETNTHDRLYELYMKNVISRQDHAELEQAYGFLMQLRFLHQIEAMESASAEPDNVVALKSLSKFERNMLREALKRIEALQTRARFDFIGTGETQMH